MKQYAFIPINKKGYDPFIDFLKGVSIVWVVITHCLPFQEYFLFSLWGAQAVPLFLLIQVFHTYKKEGSTIHYPWRNVFKRIVMPFFVMFVISLVLKIILADNAIERLEVIKSAIASGGIGPGSYYVWIYIQFFLILPLLKPILDRMSMRNVFILFVLISIFTELCCSYLNLNERIYRLLLLRYMFLIPLGLQIVKSGGGKDEYTSRNDVHN